MATIRSIDLHSPGSFAGLRLSTSEAKERFLILRLARANQADEGRTFPLELERELTDLATVLTAERIDALFTVTIGVAPHSYSVEFQKTPEDKLYERFQKLSSQLDSLPNHKIENILATLKTPLDHTREYRRRVIQSVDTSVARDLVLGTEHLYFAFRSLATFYTTFDEVSEPIIDLLRSEKIFFDHLSAYCLVQAEVMECHLIRLHRKLGWYWEGPEQLRPDFGEGPNVGEGTVSSEGVLGYCSLDDVFSKTRSLLSAIDSKVDTLIQDSLNLSRGDKKRATSHGKISQNAVEIEVLTAIKLALEEKFSRMQAYAAGFHKIAPLQNRRIAAPQGGPIDLRVFKEVDVLFDIAVKMHGYAVGCFKQLTVLETLLSGANNYKTFKSLDLQRSFLTRELCERQREILPIYDHSTADFCTDLVQNPGRSVIARFYALDREIHQIQEILDDAPPGILSILANSSNRWEQYRACLLAQIESFQESEFVDHLKKLHLSHLQQAVTGLPLAFRLRDRLRMLAFLGDGQELYETQLAHFQNQGVRVFFLRRKFIGVLLKIRNLILTSGRNFDQNWREIIQNTPLEQIRELTLKSAETIGNCPEGLEGRMEWMSVCQATMLRPECGDVGLQLSFILSDYKELIDSSMGFNAREVEQLRQMMPVVSELRRLSDVIDLLGEVLQTIKKIDALWAYNYKRILLLRKALSEESQLRGQYLEELKDGRLQGLGWAHIQRRLSQLLSEKGTNLFQLSTKRLSDIWTGRETF